MKQIAKMGKIIMIGKTISEMIELLYVHLVLSLDRSIIRILIRQQVSEMT